MPGVAVGPLDGAARLVVLSDVVHELPAKIGRGGEDAAGDHVTLDLREPELDLVEPRAVGRRTSRGGRSRTR